MGNAATSTVTVIGLGNMGSALARALLRRGHPVTVWNRTAAKAAPLLAEGATLAASPAAAIAASPLTVMCLLDHAAVMEVLAAPGVDGALAGRSFVQLTSSVPAQMPVQQARLQACGARFLAGGIMVFPGAIGRPDTPIVYAGEASVYDEHREALTALGGSLRYLGPDPAVAVGAYCTAGIFALGSIGLFLETAAMARTYGIPVDAYYGLARLSSDVVFDRVRDSARRLATGDFAGDEASVGMILHAMRDFCTALAATGMPMHLTRAFTAQLAEAELAGRANDDIACLADVTAPTERTPVGEARGPEEQAIEAELHAVLAAVSAAFARGTTPAELMPMWYDDDIIVAGEGDARATRGFAALLQKADAMLAEMGPRPRVTFRVDSPVLVSGQLAVAMVGANIQPDFPGAEAARYRMMTTWRPGKRGWRIVRELFAAGEL